MAGTNNLLLVGTAKWLFVLFRSGNEQGEIRQHVNIFVGSDDVKRLKGLATKINSNDLHIFNAVSGG